MELVKLENEHKARVIVGFFIVQYAKFGILELNKCFFDKCYDVTRIDKLEVDRLALSSSGRRKS